MIAPTGRAENGGAKLPQEKSFSLKSKSTRISIPDNSDCRPAKCYQTDGKEFEKQLTRIGRIIHDVHSAKGRTLSSRVLLVKTIGLILLLCDILYLNLYLSKTESALQLTLKKIEKLETELRYTRLSSKIFRSDLNSVKHTNSRITNDILSSSLMKKSSSPHFTIEKDSFDELFVKRSDDTMRRFVQRRVNSNDVDSKLLVFSSGNFNSSPERVVTGGPTTRKIPKKILDKDSGALNYGVASDSAILDRDSIVFLNGSVSGQAEEEVERRTRREVSSEPRGKQHKSNGGKQKKRPQHINCNLFCCSHGPLAVTLRGIHPEVIIEDGGLIAPWVADRNSAGDYPFKDFVLREGNGKLEITVKGLYLIYAQVFYLSTNHLNGFSISMQKSGNVEGDLELAKCSSDNAGKRTSEVSCFTSVVRQLLPGDRVFLIQRERNSRILHGQGHTYFGLVALNSPPKC